MIDWHKYPDEKPPKEGEYLVCSHSDKYTDVYQADWGMKSIQEERYSKEFDADIYVMKKSLCFDRYCDDEIKAWAEFNIPEWVKND